MLKKKVVGVVPLNKKKHTQKFLRELFRNTKDAIELRCFKRSNGKSKQAWYEYDEISTLSEDIRNLDEKQQYDIYIGVHPRSEKGSKNEDVTEITCLFIDHDLEGGKGVDQVIAELKEFPLHPSVIALSGRGVHAYWLLKKPVPVESIYNYKEYQKGLAKHFGADMAVSDLARVMRVPWTFNLKDIDKLVPDFPDRHSKEPVMVPTIYESECDFYRDDTGKVYRYDISEFDYYADLKEEKPVAHITEVDVDKLHIPCELKTDIGEGWNEESRFPSHSELDISVITRLFQWGYSEDTVYSIFKDKSYAISSKYYEHDSPDTYLEHQIKNAWGFLNDHVEDMLDSVRTSAPIKALYRKKTVCRVVSKVMTLTVKTADREIDNGKLYKTTIGDTVQLFYFNQNEHKLYNIESEAFEYYVMNGFGINPQEDFFKFLLNDLKRKCVFEGKEIEVHRTAFYDKKKAVLYIHKHDGEMYRLDGEDIDIVDVGTDEVFFHIEDAEPIEAEREGCERKLDELLCSKINSDEKAVLTHEEQMLLLKIWYLSLYFESLQPTKIINCVIGPQGSGKSFTHKSIGWVLYGRKFDETHFYKEDDFAVAAVNSYFLTWGNLDKSESWHQGCLARMATGLMLRKRKLYNNLGEVKEQSKCFLAINARTPEFKWADITERLLIFKVAAIKDGKRISEEDMKQHILNNRNLIWGDILLILDKVVHALRTENLKYKPIRMADFARLSCYIGHALGVDVRPLMDKITAEQTDFLSLDNPLIEAIQTLLVSNEGEWHTVGELFALPCFEKHFTSRESLGIKLRQQRTLLEKLFRVEDNKVENRHLYKFDYITPPKVRSELKTGGEETRGCVKQPLRKK